MNIKNRVCKLIAVLSLLFCSSHLMAFNAGDIVSFDPGEVACTIPDNELCERYPEWFQGVVKGSYYAMDTNSDGQFSVGERVAITPGPDGGIIIGQIQSASSGAGCPNGSGSIDQPWCFFGSTGAHQTTGYPVIDNGDGTLDFRGWGVTWNGMVNIPLGGTVWAGDTGLATLTCSSVPCTTSDIYAIDYMATIGSGAFTGVRYQLHLEREVIAPIIKVSLNVAGGDNQECASIGGHEVSSMAEVTLLNGAELGSISWSVDGVNAGSGENLAYFLSLGTHTISVTAFSTTGQQDTASATVNIVDTTRPLITADFIDNRTGAAITSIDTKNTSFVGVSISASDICDGSPSTDTIGGFSLADGDTLKIQGNLNKVELTTSSLVMKTQASDASGNKSVMTKTLTIMP